MSLFDRKSDVGYVKTYPPAPDLLTVPSSQITNVGFYALKIQVDVLTCASAGKMQQLYANATYARKVTIENITTTAATIITIVAEAGTGNGVGGAAAKGVILNAGSGAGVGGGSQTFGDTANPRAVVDASKIYWTATNTSDQISVTLEIAGERLY